MKSYFIQKLYSSNIDQVLSIISILCICATFFGFYMEYFHNKTPCILCLYQRYLYLAIGLCGIVTVLLVSKNLVVKWIYILPYSMLLVQLSLAIYHLLIEYRILSTNLCETNLPFNGSREELLQAILSAKSCDRPDILLWDISFVEISFGFSLCLVIFSILPFCKK